MGYESSARAHRRIKSALVVAKDSCTVATFYRAVAIAAYDRLVQGRMLTADEVEVYRNDLAVLQHGDPITNMQARVAEVSDEF